ncbi:MAG TPA: phytanoyl-CoA dioxygenase family protein [Pseudomonadales bacterium]
MQLLTAEQRRFWETDGYLHLPQVLDADDVALFSTEIDRIRGLPGYEPDRNPELPIGHYTWMDHAPDLNPKGFMDRRQLLGYGQAFIDLMDRSPVFDYIVDIMGPNILLSMTQAIVRPSTDKFPGYTHTDGGESLRLTRVTETSVPIAVKAMYILTDVTERDSGNLTVFPGSHMRPIPVHGDRLITPDSPGAAQLMARAGDVILFPHALWHGPARNVSGRTRKILLYNYCQLWVRCYDHHDIAALGQRCSARQRRLLGDLGYDFRPGSYFYVPKDQESVIRGGG